jgi:hypothetical protein
MLRLSAVLTGLLLLLACRAPARSPRDAKVSGTLSASWLGADTGTLTASPRAVWCPDSARLEVMAVEGDAGLGLAIYPVAELRPGRYDAFDPDADSIHRPGVTAAARWFTEKAIAAYRTDSGGLDLTRNGPALGATFRFRMRSAFGLDTTARLRLTGRFDGVVPSPCPADSVPPAPSGR